MSNESEQPIRRSTKSYLGDSVYAEIEHGRIKLTTENGFGASNTIYLEPEVVEALLNYHKRMQEE